ncbi:MAG TPA: CocE/NonD family hydrolase C-terminal non-catalytic domain-containing protein, partial [Actinopolymorphaceae bacterium]
TYRALRDPGTPVRMIWHKWGHSGQDPAPGEFDPSGERPPETTYLGRRVLDWYAYWLRDDRSRSLGPAVTYFRDWIPYDGSSSEGAEPAYAAADSLPIGEYREMYLSGNGSLTADRSKVVEGKRSWVNLPGGVPSSYSEIPPGTDEIPPSDTPGTFAAWTSEPLETAIDTVGMPTLDVRFDAPTAKLTQRTLGVAGRLVVFAKLYDVASDGSVTLVHRLVSPVRVPDVEDDIRLELPGIVHRWQSGHRIRIVLAASDAAYAGNVSVHPVTVRTKGDQVPVLRLPVVQ